MKLEDYLAKVDSKKTFLDFVEALSKDKRSASMKEKFWKSSSHGPGHNGWQNERIETFLDSVHSFGEDSSDVGEQPDWKAFALLLYAGKYYE